jgi:hypothetical protein
MIDQQTLDFGGFDFFYCSMHKIKIPEAKPAKSGQVSKFILKIMIPSFPMIPADLILNSYITGDLAQTNVLEKTEGHRGHEQDAEIKGVTLKLKASGM